MGQGKSRWERFREAVANVHLLVWLVGLVSTPVVAAVTLVVGLSEQIPLTYVITATVLSIAGILSTANQLGGWWAKRRPDYSYGLAYEGAHIDFDPDNSAAALQIGVDLRNMSAGPIKYEVERFDVVIGNRTIAKPIFANKRGTISIRVLRRYRYAPFPKDDIQEFLGKRPTGTLTFEAVYGHPDSKPVRRLKMKIDLSFRLDDNPGISDIIDEESDESI